MARDNESSSSSESDSDDDLPSYNTIVQQNLNYAKVCTSQQKKLEKLKEKLDSSQEAYKTLLEQYETFANLNIELSTKIEQLEASASLRIFKILLQKFIKRRHFIITITLTRG